MRCTIWSEQRFPFKKGKQKQNRAPPETTTSTVEQETQSIESVDFTTSTWKDELQDRLDETSNKLNVTIATNKQQMEYDFISDLQNELKDFQTALMSLVENMTSKKMEALTIAMQQSFQDTVAQKKCAILTKKQYNEINANHSTRL